MSKMQRAGKARHEAKVARLEVNAKARAESMSRRIRREAWERLETVFRDAKEHGIATRERLLEFVTFRFGDHAERAERVTHEVARHVLQAADPIAALNALLNVEEAKPTVDRSWNEVKEKK